MKKPWYEVIKYQYCTEKTQLMSSLASMESNPSLKRFRSPKIVFIVDEKATKGDIRSAVEELYKEQKVKVTKVNTLARPSKPRRVRGRLGKTSFRKKAIVTLSPQDQIDPIV